MASGNGSLPPRQRFRYAGLAMAAVLGVSAIFFALPAWSASPVPREVFCWVLTGGMLAAYAYGYRALNEMPVQDRRTRRIVLPAVGFCLLALLVAPFHDTDLSSYINVGWQQAQHGLNPYVSVMVETPGWGHDPMLRPTYWDYTPCAYGFLFSRIAQVVCWLGDGNYSATILLFRLVSVAMFFAAAGVIWRGSRLLRLADPDHLLYLFLWNPLLLVMAVLQGHNDIWMGMFTALAVYAAMAGSCFTVMPLLFVSVLIKHLSGMLAPFLFLFLCRRHGWKKALASTGVAVVLTVPLAWPYLRDLPHFKMIEGVRNAGELHNSLITMLYFPFEVARKPLPWIEPMGRAYLGSLRLVGLMGFAVLWLGLGWRRLRNGNYSNQELVRDAVLLHFVLIVIVSSKFYSWYLGMFFPLALWLAPTDWLRRAVLALSCAQLLSLTAINQAHFLNVLVMIVAPLLWVWRTRPRQSVRESIILRRAG